MTQIIELSCQGRYNYNPHVRDSRGNHKHARERNKWRYEEDPNQTSTVEKYSV